MIGQGTYFGTIRNPFNIPFIVGAYSSIADGFAIIGSQHPLEPNVSTYPFFERYNVDYTPCTNGMPVIIGNDVWIGMDVSVMEGVRIGDGAIIGAKSNVVEDVLPFAVVAGNPAKPKKYRFTLEIIGKLQKIKWWEWPHDLIIKRIQDFKDIKSFVEKYEV